MAKKAKTAKVSATTTSEQVDMAHKILNQNPDMQAVYIVDGLYYASEKMAKEAAAQGGFEITTIKREQKEQPKPEVEDETVEDELDADAEGAQDEDEE